MYETVIGLEIHIQLNTKSKAFCSDYNLTDSEANENISFISLAHPGSLPKMNMKHIEKAVLLGLAFGCDINEHNYFDRKNYFYPDLPKGYQITQDKQPYCKNGNIRFISDEKLTDIRLHHIHMEEDAGKSNHELDEKSSLVDYNRGGVPLLEIVTEPDFRSGQEVSDFLAELQRVVQYLSISDGNMEEGSFRCDCNVSVRKIGEQKLGERCEIKNMNSRRFAKNAIEYEALRQIAIIENGGTITKTTMLYDPVEGVTRAMRKKESENDYRYFPEPDLPPLVLSKKYISDIDEQLIALPIDHYLTLTEKYGLSHSDTDFLVSDNTYVSYFLELRALIHESKDLSDLLIMKIIPHIKKENISLLDLGPKMGIVAFLNLLNNNQIAKSSALQTVFPIWIQDISVDPLEIARKEGILQSNDQSFLDDIIHEVLTQNSSKLTEYRKGKKGLLGFFMGQVMQKSNGKANPQQLQDKLTKALDDN